MENVKSCNLTFWCCWALSKKIWFFLLVFLLHDETSSFYLEPFMHFCFCTQPPSIVTDEICTACDFNRPGKTCLRKLEWVWRGEIFMAKKRFAVKFFALFMCCYVSWVFSWNSVIITIWRSNLSLNQLIILRGRYRRLFLTSLKLSSWLSWKNGWRNIAKRYMSMPWDFSFKGQLWRLKRAISYSFSIIWLDRQ